MVDITQPTSWDLVAEGYASFGRPMLEPFSADALDWAKVEAGELLLDVAAGPGTLALQAARRGARVTATDFSPAMVETLRERARSEGLSEIRADVADGQNLPFSNASFDVACSMFGLFIFPDRARGFAELFRVLRRGGRALVSSWPGFPEDHPFTISHAVLSGEKGGGGALPLSTESELMSEMGEAGFEVEVREFCHTQRYASVDELHTHMLRSHVGYVVASKQLPADELAQLHTRLREALEEATGGRELAFEMRAWLALGRKGA